jgi:hypothetical protein
MRLWSIHPVYLDSKGLVALWREGLLALAVLKGNTKGYKNHPQLKRFLKTVNPVQTINRYLWYIYYEATTRGYNFNSNKLNTIKKCAPIKVTDGQLRYEIDHLKKKLKRRDSKKYDVIKNIIVPRPHPLFVKVKGKVEEWEKDK